ncbi:MAG: hypothetical protein AMS22_13250 [Thiotrichales bacterium SG8_50]|nr:MAG: hypothetical protein AMS22_13250 [Thiotrichales bacterium SG8_50]
MNNATPIAATAKNTRSLRLLLLVALCLLLAVARPLAAQQIYKWTDENGSVSYSDRPLPSVEAEKVRIMQDTNDSSTAAAGEAVKRMQATSKDLEASRKEREAARAKEQEERRQALDQSARSEAESDGSESSDDGWYHGIYTQRPPVRPPARPPNTPPQRPRPPPPTQLPSNAPAGLR